LDLKFLRQIFLHHLERSARAEHFDLTVHFINAAEMARVNQDIPQHSGSTDVITLDYSDEHSLTGEIFICVDEAILQPRRFRANWQTELVRYFIHAVLHLQGHDDLKPAPRRKMKA